MKKTALTAAALLAAVAFIGAGCQEQDRDTIGRDLTNESLAIQAEGTETVPEEIEESKELEAAIPTSFYVAEKVDYTTTVYSEQTQSGDRTTLFSFDESWKYEPESGNTYERMLSAVDYSPERNEFAYATGSSVVLRNAETGAESTLIQQTGARGEIDGLQIPTWSLDGSFEGVLTFLAPQFSEDGTKLHVTAGYYEGLSHMIIDLETKEVQKLTGVAGEHIGGHLFDWSETGADAVVATPAGEMAAEGLLVAHTDAYEAAEDIYAHESALSVSSAVWLEDGTLAIVYQELDYDNSWSSFEESDYYLARANADGTELQKIKVFNGKPTFEFSNGMDAYFTYEAASGEYSIGKLDGTTNEVTEVLGAGALEIMRAVDSESGAKVVRLYGHTDDGAFQNLRIYTQKNDIAYQSRHSSAGAIEFIDWVR